MSIEYKIIENKKLVLAKGTSEITGADVINHIDELASDSRYMSPMKKLVDYRFVENINISQDESITIALKKDTLSAKFLNERCAFISPEPETYVASRVHQYLVNSQTINISVFKELGKGLDWLEIEVDSEIEEWLNRPIK